MGRDGERACEGKREGEGEEDRKDWEETERERVRGGEREGEEDRKE